MMDELARSNRFDRPLSIILADLDLLRNINNTYGHLAGDEVLIGVSKAMKNAIRDYDVVCRFGGEEFAILLPETTLSHAYERAEILRKAIECIEFTVPTSVIPIHATMSFGVAHRENFSQSADEITHNADLALYHSKLSGRNRTFAYHNEEYVDFEEYEKEADVSQSKALQNPNQEVDVQAVSPQQESKPARAETLHPAVESHPVEMNTPENKPKKRRSSYEVYIFITVLALLSIGLFTLTSQWGPFMGNSVTYDWLGPHSCGIPDLWRNGSACCQRSTGHNPSH
jgi:diguanylate cyclase (GGDEF)-like protein